MKRTLILIAAVSLVAALASASAVRAHWTGSDHPSFLYTWHTGGSIPSGWVDALINGVLVWDNVTGQCHDFQRVSGGGHTLHMREYQDGAHGQHAFATSAHDRVSYDSSETWHLNVNAYPGGNSLDLWSVSAHENGHILHLQHSSNTADTMWQSTAYGTYHRRTLEANDIFRERTLYPGC